MNYSEEENAIKSLKEFAYTEYGSLSVIEARTISNLIEKQKHIIEGKEALIDTMTHNEEVLNKIIERKDKEINQLKDELGYTRKLV